MTRGRSTEDAHHFLHGFGSDLAIRIEAVIGLEPLDLISQSVVELSDPVVDGAPIYPLQRRLINGEVRLDGWKTRGSIMRLRPVVPASSWPRIDLTL
jgi:hypothetical protein